MPPRRASPSSSPSWASTSWAMGSATCWTRASAARASRCGRRPAMPMSELLSVSELSVEFTTDRGVAQVLDRISLAIGHGEVVGLVGESGCGKTTLARTVLGVLPAGGRIRGGAIHWEGRDLLGMDSRIVNDEIRGRAITFIPQDP